MTTPLPLDDQAVAQVFDVELETMTDEHMECRLEDDCREPVTHIGVMLPCRCLGMPGCLPHIQGAIDEVHHELFALGHRMTCVQHKAPVTSVTARPI